MYKYVVVIVVVGATNVLKVTERERESHCGGPLISRNFGDSSEIVSVVS